ncbi:MAG: hypothetical protein ACYDAO_03560 [Thermoplasmataceae archaeon]
MNKIKILSLVLVTIMIFSGGLTLIQTSEYHIKNVKPLINTNVFSTLNSRNNLGGNLSLKNCYVNSTISLNSNLYANNLTINKFGIIDTNGFNIFLTGVFDNSGKVVTGSYISKYGRYYPCNNLFSYGGSGGGARANNNTLFGFGGGTLVSGGAGTNGTNAQSGSSITMPSLNNGIIQGMYASNFNLYLSGGQGQSYQCYCNNNFNSISVKGGYGSNGLYIQAKTIIAGNINAAGQNGTGDYTYNALSGGGGGGVVILAYSSNNYQRGNVSTLGGFGAKSGVFTAGNGGSGSVYTYSYGSVAPISVNTVMHLSVLTPLHVFNGSKESISEKYYGSDSSLININGTYTITSLNTSSITYNATSIYYIDGLFANLHKHQQISYNDSQSTMVSYFGVGPRTLFLLNNGIMPVQFNYLSRNNPYFYGLKASVKTNVVINSPMGYLSVDEVSFHSPVLGVNTFVEYIDSSSGLIIKTLSSQLSFEVTSTNVPLDHASAPLNYSIIGGLGITAAIAVAGFSFYFYRKKKAISQIASKEQSTGGSDK